MVIFFRTMAKPESVGRATEWERAGGWALAGNPERREVDVLGLGGADRLK